MKALTIWQPWAAFVAAEIKRNETRSWSTRHRGEIAIHASLNSPYTGGLDRYMTDVIDAGLRRLLVASGAIIAVGEITDCQPTCREGVRPVRTLLSSREIALGDYSEGRYAWAIRNVRRLRNPVPCKGAQGLWTVPAEIEALVLEQVEGVP
jgi:hypothetical protein